MKVKKMSSFVKPDEDIKDQDKVTILDEGKEESGEFGTKYIFKLKLANGEDKLASLNGTSMNNLIDIFGDETSEWVGKEVIAHVITQNVGGKMKKVLYLQGEGLDLEGNILSE